LTSVADDDTEDPATAYQALYRRFRPQTFRAVLGQEHVTRALRHAVRDGKVAHAYLFSGPRGTGKTSTARILAMALNCEQPIDGEPDGTCPSCVAIRQGTSLDVQELDSATNRGIDEMRDLLGRVALGTPGRWKIYIIDEVHQMTSAAASALLKTLEEPPGHVIFVLATTDPQKVLPTIRSRTQHFEFRLLGADVLASLLRDVNDQAALGLTSEAIDLVVSRGHGSARDALSALDQVAAAGDIYDDSSSVNSLVDAIADRDPGRVLREVAEAVSAGRDARRLATDVLDHLRDGFLATQARSLVLLPEEAVATVEALATRFGTPALVRAMEVLGQALIDMRDAPDPRITLEVALVRLAAPEADDSRGAILERLERLERLVGQRDAVTADAGESAAGVPTVRSIPPPAPPVASPPVLTPPPITAGVGQSALGAHRRPRETGLDASPSPKRTPLGEPALGSEPTLDSGPTPPGPRPAASSQPLEPLPSREALTIAWGDTILPGLRPGVKVYLSGGRFLGVDASAAIFAVPDKGLLARAEPNRAEVEAALAAHFGRAVPLRLVLDEPGTLATPSGPPAEDLAGIDLHDLQDAPAAVVSPEQRLLEAFPGAEEVSP
jgi:DNA polymerase-3 subunit gamma/tau